jgi:hypothetical protein
MASQQPTIFRPWQAEVQARLTRRGIDEVEEIDYENGGRFVHRRHLVVGPGSGAVDVLNREQLDQLLADLRAELRAAPAGVDLVGLEVFTDLIEDVLRAEPASSRFDEARFGAVSQDESRSVLYGHVAFGADVAGTVRDVDHLLSFEQHPVTLPPGRYRPLSRADQASLARRLQLDPPADRLWQRIQQDASRESFGIAERFLAQNHADLVAAGGRLTLVSSAAAADLLPGLDVYSFALGMKYPITTGKLARRTIVVNRGERSVVLDLDSTAADSAVAAAVAGSELLPAADPSSAAEIAEAVAALAPLDPFWSNPTEGAFQTSGGGTIASVWSGSRFRYEVDFANGGAIAGIVRDDRRIKPI